MEIPAKATVCPNCKRTLTTTNNLILLTAFIVIVIGVYVVLKNASNSYEPQNITVSSEDYGPTIIDDVTQYSNISEKKLKNIMGKPKSIEKCTNKTANGNFKLKTLSYDKDSLHFEFIIANKTVVRLSIYSEKYWNNTGDNFNYTGNKDDILKMFNVIPNKNAALKADTNYAYIISPVNKKIAEFNIQDISSNTFGLVKVTYNLNYFD